MTVLHAASIEDTDYTLVLKFQDGNTKVMDELVVRYHSRIFNICLQMLGNLSDAEDAAQNTFIAIFKGLHKFKGQSALSTWIYRITINKCLKFRRSSPVEVHTECDLSIHNDNHEEMHNRQIVRSMLQKLAPHYRTVLVLRYFQQLSYEEIGETLGWSSDKVRCYLNRARKCFKQLYIATMKEGGQNAM